MESKTEKDKIPPWEARAAKPKAGQLLRKLLFWLIVLGLVGLVVYGLIPKPIEVETAVLKRGPLTICVVEEGRTKIRNRYIVSAPVAGQLRRPTFKAGDAVRAKETILAVVDPSSAPLLDSRSRAQSEAAVQAADAGVLKAKEALAMAKTSQQFAASSWDRVKNLSQKGTVSDTDRDNAERDAEMKVREKKSADFAVKIAEFELVQAKAALLQMDSAVGSGAAMEIRAPVSGRVLRVQQENATVVAPGASLLEIGDPEDIEIESEVLSRDAVIIRPGTPVTVDQWGGEESLQAVVKRVEPAAFTKVSALGVEEQRVLVLCDLTNPPPAAKLLGDRFRVEVRIAVWEDTDALLIPAGALFREGTEWKTFVLNKDQAHAVKLQTGRTDGRMTQVLDGITAGTEVLLHPPDTVKDGVQVKRRGM